MVFKDNAAIIRKRALGAIGEFFEFDLDRRFDSYIYFFCLRHGDNIPCPTMAVNYFIDVFFGKLLYVSKVFTYTHASNSLIDRIGILPIR